MSSVLGYDKEKKATNGNRWLYLDLLDIKLIIGTRYLQPNRSSERQGTESGSCEVYQEVN